jgi:hypothetical protein
MKTLHLLALAPLVGALAAQTSPPPLLGARSEGAAPQRDPYFAPSTRAWPAGLPMHSRLCKTVTASLNGFGVPDVVTLDGGLPVLATAPGLHQSVGWLPGPGGSPVADIVDIAVLRGRGRPDGGSPLQDALVLAGAEGTRIWRRDFATGHGSFSAVGGSEWDDTRLLAVHRAAPLSIYGIDGAGVLRRAEGNFSGNSTAPGYQTSTTNYGVFTDAVALTCVDWDSTPGFEVAVLTTTALTVLHADGSVAFTATAPVAEGQTLTTVHGPTEWLAWLVPGSNGSWLHYGRQNALHSTALATRFVAMTAASMDFDAFDELVLSTEANHDVTVLFNQQWQGLPPFYNPDYAVRIAIAAADPRRIANGSNAAVADFDADGDLDVFAAIPGDGNTGASFQMQTLRYYDGPSAVQLSQCDYSSNGDDESYFDLTFTALPNTETQVLLWQELPGPNGTWTTGSQPVALPTSFVTAQNGMGQLQLTLDRQHLISGGQYHLLLRPVLRTGGVVTAVGKAYLGILWVTAGSNSEASFLRATTNAGDGNGNGSGGAVRVGGVVGSGPLPPAPPGLPPEGDDGDDEGGGG